MNAKTDHKIDRFKGVLYKTYTGNVSIEFIKNTWRKIINEHNSEIELKGFVLDYRHAHFSFEHKRHVEITNFYKEFIQYFGNKRIAIITDTPGDTVYPILIQTKDLGYASRPFSTLEAAERWVLFGEDTLVRKGSGSEFRI